jgi:hypothetical protein
MVFAETATNPKGVIVLDAGGAELTGFSKSNDFMKSDLYTDYNFLYINILNKGSADVQDCYDVVIRTIATVHRINTNSFFFIQNKSPDKLAVQQPLHIPNGITTIEIDSKNLGYLLSSLDSASFYQVYQVPDHYFELNEKYEKRMSNYKRNFDVGLFYSPLFLTGTKLNFDKGALGTYGVSLTKNIGVQNAITLKFGGSFKIPDQKSLQSGMQTKIMSAVQSGANYFYINENLSGHVFAFGELSYKYFSNADKQFRPYLSIGIGINNFTTMNGTIQDTIDISDIDMSNMSSAQDLIGNSDMNPAMEQTGTLFFSPMAELGFEYRLSPYTKINVSMPFKYFIDQSGTKYNTFAYGLNFGFNFTLNPGKFSKIKPYSVK